MLKFANAIVAVGAWVALAWVAQALSGYSGWVPDAFNYRWAVNAIELLILVPTGLMLSAVLSSRDRHPARWLHASFVGVGALTLGIVFSMIWQIAKPGAFGDVIISQSAWSVTHDPLLSLFCNQFTGRAVVLVVLVALVRHYRVVLRAPSDVPPN